MKNKINSILLNLIIFFLIALSIRINACAKTDDSTLVIDYIDVGQGDCALVECDGEYMLIDGGPSDASSVVYTILRDKGIKNIKLMIATHPDADHIGGLSGALNFAKVDKCLCPVTTHDTKTFRSLCKYLNRQNKSLTVPKAGDIYNIGSAKATILGPTKPGDESNNNSIVIRIDYGENTFLFTGDAEYGEEIDLIDKYKDLDCDVLKVGHHGSSSSTSDAFLRAVNPEYAIISVGRQNPYGHPEQSILDKLSKVGSVIYRTDLQGDIIVISDGKNITINTEKKVNQSDISKKKVDQSDVSKTKGLSVSDDTAYVLNTRSKKFHMPRCDSVADMSPKNKREVNLPRDEIISEGYVPCKRCNP